MTPPKTGRKRYVTAGWTDDRVPDLAGLLPDHIDAAAFGDWLGERLGDYRFTVSATATWPAPAAQRNAARALAEELRRVRAALGTEAIPPHVEAEAAQAAHRAAHDLSATRARVRRDLAALAGWLQAAGERLGATPGERGRKPASARDTLYRAIVARLRAESVGAAEARRIAEAVLIRCRVAVPEDKRRQRRIEGQR